MVSVTLDYYLPTASLSPSLVDSTASLCVSVTTYHIYIIQFWLVCSYARKLYYTIHKSSKIW